MASGVKTLRINITGDSKGAQQALVELRKSSEQTTSAMGGLGSRLSSLGAGMGSAISTVTGVVTSSTDALKDTVAQTTALQKVMGGSTEDASRLAHVLNVTGVDTGTFAKGMLTLEKNISSNSPAFAKLGINARDAHGNMRPMSELLPEIMARLNAMPAGAEKNALMLQLFGKNAQQLTPILGMSGDQLKSLEAESDRMGTTIGGSTTEAVKTQARAQREMQEAMKGIKLVIAEQLLPALTKLAQMFVEHVLPVIKDVVKWMKDHATIVKVLVVAVAAFAFGLKLLNIGMTVYRGIMMVMRGLTIAWTAAQWLLNVAMSANPIGLIIIAIAALIAIFVVLWNKCAWFRDFWKAVWNFIKDHFKTIMLIIGSIMTGGLLYLFTHWSQVWNAVKGFFVWIWDFLKAHFREALLIIGSIMTGGLLYVFTHWSQVWNGVKAVFSAIWDGIKSVFKAAVDWVVSKAEGFLNFWSGLPGKIGRFFTGMWDGLKDGFKAAINFIIDIWNKVADGLSFTVPDWVPGIGGDTFGLPHIDPLYQGGTLRQAGMALVGERGPELLNLPGGSNVIPLPKLAGAGGATYNVTVNVAGHVRTEQDLVVAVRDGLLRVGKRNGGRTGLVPA